MKTKTLEELILENESTSGIEEFFGLLFQSRDVAHLNHLATKSYAEHMALGGYYDGIVGLVDGLVEAYQGMYSIVDIKIPNAEKQDSIGYFESLLKMVIDNKDNLFKDSYLLNMVDTITELITGTLYKLKYLK